MVKVNNFRIFPNAAFSLSLLFLLFREGMKRKWKGMKIPFGLPVLLCKYLHATLDTSENNKSLTGSIDALLGQLTLAWHCYELHTSVVAGPLWPWPYSYSCAIGVAWPEQRSRKNSLIWQMKKGRLKWGATDSSVSSGLKTVEHAVKGLHMDFLLGISSPGGTTFHKREQAIAVFRLTCCLGSHVLPLC